jgi:hypothetical protein
VSSSSYRYVAPTSGSGSAAAAVPRRLAEVFTSQNAGFAGRCRYR